MYCCGVTKRLSVAVAALTAIACGLGCTNFATADQSDEASSGAEMCEESSRALRGVYYFTRPSVSSDGRWVAFSGRRSVDGGPLPLSTDAYIEDLQTGTVAHALDLTWWIREGTAIHNDVVISANGRYLVFYGFVPAFLDEQYTGYNNRLYRYDREAAELVEIARGVSIESYAISPDGDRIAYTMHPSATSMYNHDLYIYSAATGQSELVVAHTGIGGVWGPLEFSGNGRYVAYQKGEKITPGWPGEPWQYYLYDLETKQSEMVSVNAQGEPAADEVLLSGIDYSGRYVVLRSPARNLAPDDPDCFPDIFVRDRQLNRTLRIVSQTGAEWDWPGGADITDDGRWLVFTNDVGAVGEPRSAELVVHDLETGAQRQVWRRSNASAGDVRPRLSANGRVFIHRFYEGDSNGSSGDQVQTLCLGN